MRDKPEISSFHNIAVIQTAFLGDVVLALPLLETIKKSTHHSKLIFVTTPEAASIASISSAPDTIVAFDKRGRQRGYQGIRSLSEELKYLRVDCIIAPHRSIRTTLAAFLTKPSYSVTFDRTAGASLYKTKIKYDKDLHEIDRNLSLLQAFKSIHNRIDQLREVDLSFALEDTNYIENLLQENGINENEKVVALAPGSVWATKRWKKEHFSDLASMLTDRGIKTVIIGSRKDSSLCGEIAGKTGAVNLAGETAIPQTIYMLKQCSALVTNDSSPTHFGGLAGCPVITIFGPTSPKFGFAPRNEFDVVMENGSLKCKPCHIHGRQKCPIKTHECMESVNPESVYRKVIQLLDK